MDKADFDELLTKVTPLMHRQDTWMREVISVSERLSITLRYLATGDSYQSLEYLYRIPKSTLSYFFFLFSFFKVKRILYISQMFSLHDTTRTEFLTEVLLGTVHLSLEAFLILFTSYVFVSSTHAC